MRLPAFNILSSRLPMRLLIVEDNRALTESLSRLFARKGFAVDTVGTLHATAGHPHREGPDVAEVGRAGRSGAAAEPGRKALQIPVGRHANNGTAPTQGFLGTNVAREPSGGPVGSSKRRADGLEI